MLVSKLTTESRPGHPEGGEGGQVEEADGDAQQGTEPQNMAHAPCTIGMQWIYVIPSWYVAIQSLIRKTCDMGNEPMRICRGLGAILGKTRPGQSHSLTFLKTGYN